MSNRIVIYHDLDGDDPDFDLHVTHLSGRPIIGAERTDVLVRLGMSIADEVDEVQP